jgi:hypothetical protein
MHLEKAYLTTTRYNSKKKKSNNKRLAQAQAEHEAWLTSMGVGKSTLPTNAKGQRVGLNEIPNYKEHQATAKLSNQVAGNGTAKERVQYTGTEIAGIVTTHKSNLMPIRKDNMQAAKDAATMRRS